MQKKFEINQTKIKGGCQLGRKVVNHNSKSDLPLKQFTTRIKKTFLKKQHYSYFSDSISIKTWNRFAYQRHFDAHPSNALPVT